MLEQYFLLLLKLTVLICGDRNNARLYSLSTVSAACSSKAYTKSTCSLASGLRLLNLCKALGAVYSASGNAASKKIVSSSRAMLLFGSPVNAGEELASIAALSFAGSDDATEAPVMKAMKRDARWLHVANQQFQDFASRFRMFYFRESAGDVMNDPETAATTGGETVIQMRKLHGAMIRFAATDDDDLQRVLAVLGEAIQEILDNEAEKQIK